VKRSSLKLVVSSLALGSALAVALPGCGYSEEEMNAKRREIDKLTKDLQAAQALHDNDQKELQKAQSELEALGARSKETKEEAERLGRALAEYKQRSDQLAAIEARFRDLRNRLEKLTKVGVQISVRKNRMVIQLPGDVLFDSGKDELKREGREVLAQVADVIRNDKDLSTRTFQVVGHTDDAKYPPGGPFKDNWGLSLARARTVLLFMIAALDGAGPKNAGPRGGGLDAMHLSATGFGETDPIAGTQGQETDEERKKNRRVELVLEPDVREMMDLSKVH
jgi:chemotaxis protein MotB